MKKAYEPALGILQVPVDGQLDPQEFVAQEWSDPAPKSATFIAEAALKRPDGPFPIWPEAALLAAAGKPEWVREFAGACCVRIRQAGYRGIWGDPQGILSDATLPWLRSAVADAAAAGFRGGGLRVAVYGEKDDGWWIDDQLFVRRSKPAPSAHTSSDAESGRSPDAILVAIEEAAITLVDDPLVLPLRPHSRVSVHDPGATGAVEGLGAVFEVVDASVTGRAEVAVWVDEAGLQPGPGGAVIAVACRRRDFLAEVPREAVKVAVYSERANGFSALAQKLVGAAPFRGRLPAEVTAPPEMTRHSAHFTTEQPHPHPALRWLETQDIAEAASAIVAEEAAAIRALAAAAPTLATVIGAVREAWSHGGRLFYVGAGSAGRAGMMDSVEIPPTFGVGPEMAQAILAGGPEAVRRAREGAEDDDGLGAADVEASGVGGSDVLLAITAHGNTPYVLGAARRARERGAVVVGMVNNGGTALATVAHHMIEVASGPEILVGSTRLKAGTAEKVLLNTISTLSMVGLGKTYDNLMVDFVATNQKLRERAIRVFMMATGRDRHRAVDQLTAAQGELKTAILATLAGCPVQAARRLLSLHGSVKRALDAQGTQTKSTTPA